MMEIDTTEPLNPGLEIMGAEPKTFDQAVELITGLMAGICIERESDYGPHNILGIGVQGCLSRAIKDKIARIRNQIDRVELTEDGEVHLVFKAEGLKSPQFWDAFIDAGNYIAVLPIMTLMGWMELPLEGKSTSPEGDAE